MYGRLSNRWERLQRISLEVGCLLKHVACHDRDLTPKIEADGKIWRFMGLYSKNREEWATAHIANMYNSVTTVAFYDTLGPQAIEFVIKQTNLTSICCADVCVPKLITLKKEGKADSVVNLICMDPVKEEWKGECKELGMEIFYFYDLVAEGAKSSFSDFEEPTPQSCHMFCYTSGTTGDPKAAMLCHES